jgi:lysophospholipase L1-like esterase
MNKYKNKKTLNLKKMIKNIKWLFLVSLTIVACSKDCETAAAKIDSSDGQPLTKGNADFSKYVALGDSFAAGFSDNALFIEGQKTSYPNIMAQQFATVGGGAFTNPFMSDNIGGFASSTSYLPRLYFTGIAASPIGMVTGPSTTVQTARLTGFFNNMGIPGAKVGDLDFPGYGSALGNPYFARFASTPLATAVDDAIAQSPTFFSLFIGGNDVLGYATAGGTGTPPTPPATFDTKYNSLITKLTAGGRKGVVGNLPYVNALPYFTTVPTNPVPLVAAQVAQLGPLMTALNNALIANGDAPRFTTLAVSDTNALLINDESQSPKQSIYYPVFLFITSGSIPAATYLSNLYSTARHASNVMPNVDYIVLTARGAIGTVQPSVPVPGFDRIGVTYPMQDNTTVTAFEANEIKVATDAYNVTIQAAATAKSLAYVDTKSVMNQLTTTGVSANGFTINSSFIFGGAFSLDGIHPSPRGYALIANSFLNAINVKYGSNMAPVSFADYRVMFPKVL